MILLRAWLFAGLTVLSNSALACSCTKPVNTLDEEIRIAFGLAAAVVQAEAVEVVGNGIDPHTGKPEPNYFPGHVEHVIWRISGVWKGSYEPGATFETVTKTECCTCGRAVQRGEVYLLYLGSRSPPALSICSSDKRLEDAAPDVVILNNLVHGAGT